MNPLPRHGRLLRSSPWARAGVSVILTLLAALAVLACLFDVASLRVAHAMAGRMDATATVVVWDHGLESSDAAAARAAEIIAALPGVTSARPMDPAPGDALVARLAGAPDVTEPRLVAVEASPGGAVLAARLTRALSAAAVPSRLADKTLRLSRSGRMAALAMAAGLVIPLGAVAAFALACWAAARREASKSAGTLGLLRMAGATDGFVAGLIRRRVASLALVCALWGAATALAAAALASRAVDLAPLERLVQGDLLTPWPLVLLAAWLLGTLAAWLAARALLASVSP